MTKKIQLHGKYGDGKVALVDDDDYDKVSIYRWRVSQNGYVISNDENHDVIYMHRFILGTRSGMLTDHINRNRIDNRKMNLRECPNSQNQANTISWKGLPTKGVYKPKGYKRWMARISFNGNRIYLGYFETKDAAVQAYNKKAVELFGEFANG